jgi:hypothetical protein
MSRERWGTFSVIDHKNAAALVPDVLLYDRLVLPIPTSDEERIRWNARGWAPDVLDKRLEQLGPLAVKANWSYTDRQQAITAWEERLKSVRFDAEQIIQEIKEKAPYQMTRMVLADKPWELPPGVTHIVPVAAFQSEEEFRACCHLAAPTVDRTNLGFLLGRKLAIPSDRDPEKALAKAVELASKDDKFRENRRKLYEWQEGIVRDGIPLKDAVREMDQMVEAYNRSVEQATRTVYYKFAFTVAGVALGLAAAPLSVPFATATVLLSVVQFATLDRRPVIEPGENAPAAMFHDVRKIALWH